MLGKQGLRTIQSSRHGARVVTDDSVFPGILEPGMVGLHRVSDCLSVARGPVWIGDSIRSAFIPLALPGGALLTFPLYAGEIRQTAVPVPCNEPVRIEVHAVVR